MKNLRLNARTSDTLADLCDGARYARIQETLPGGTSALTSILFFDEIQRDKKGFVSGEGIVIVGGFFAKDAWESSYAKVSLGTFPKMGITKKDANRVVKRFKKAMRASQHAAIAQCYREYTAKGGHIINLQNQQQVCFPKAVVLAVYGDFPATQKMTLTGSACPMCFTPLGKMSEGRAYNNEVQYIQKCDILLHYIIKLKIT
jgi:hypothetical protein